MNKAFLIGRLTRDPELKYTQNNIAVTNFTVAVNRRPSEDGTQLADFIPCIAWQKQAENVKKYISKGSQVSVEGRLQTRTYDDKDGKKVYVMEVIAENVHFLDPKKTDAEIKAEPTVDPDKEYKDFGNSVELSDDDIAF